MKNELVKSLSLNSRLCDLILFDLTIDINLKVSDALKALRKNDLAPGLILTDESRYAGMISRNKLYDWMSRPYSQELFTKRSIKYLAEEYALDDILVFDSTTYISDATYNSLKRKMQTLYEPIVVKISDTDYRLLDIHQLLLAQSQIHMQTVESLRSANEFKSEILNIAAHDLKNPLNSVMGFAKLISEDCRENDPIKSMSDMIYNSAERMVELIKNLLESSLIEVGRISIQKIPVDVNQLVKIVIDVNRQQADKKKQILVFESNVPDNYKILADKIRIEEALDNLISNAIKYSPFEKDIVIKLQKELDKITFQVIDKGPGIKEEEKSKLFNKFQRLSTKPTGGESSTGLGLYIVKQTIELHGGKVFCESNEGCGSKFLFELPL